MWQINASYNRIGNPGSESVDQSAAYEYK